MTHGMRRRMAILVVAVGVAAIGAGGAAAFRCPSVKTCDQFTRICEPIYVGGMKAPV